MTLEACNRLRGTAWDGCKSRRSAPAKKEVDMLNSFKSKAPEKDKNVTANAAEAIGNMAQPQHSVVEQAAARLEPTTKAGTGSCIGSDMSIVGKIECNGPAQVFGRIEGELRASDLLVGDGATIDGSVIAQNVTICGRIKGTIRAVRVKLQNGGAVEGDIFHRSLSIDENSLFEGSSRRVENPTEIPSSIDAKVPQTTDTQSPTPMSDVAADLQRVESALTDWSESTVGPKH
jgi:cytoskeletal protein CcmA (bactofilin family)